MLYISCLSKYVQGCMRGPLARGTVVPSVDPTQPRNPKVCQAYSARSSRLSAQGHILYVPTSLFTAPMNTLVQLWTAPVLIPNLFATSTGPRKKDKHEEKEEKTFILGAMGAKPAEHIHTTESRHVVPYPQCINTAL